MIAPTISGARMRVGLFTAPPRFLPPSFPRKRESRALCEHPKILDRQGTKTPGYARGYSCHGLRKHRDGRCPDSIFLVLSEVEGRAMDVECCKPNVRPS